MTEMYILHDSGRESGAQLFNLALRWLHSFLPFLLKKAKLCDALKG